MLSQSLKRSKSAHSFIFIEKCLCLPKTYIREHSRFPFEGPPATRWHRNPWNWSPLTKSKLQWSYNPSGLRHIILRAPQQFVILDIERTSEQPWQIKRVSFPQSTVLPCRLLPKSCPCPQIVGRLSLGQMYTARGAFKDPGRRDQLPPEAPWAPPPHWTSPSQLQYSPCPGWIIFLPSNQSRICLWWAERL